MLKDAVFDKVEVKVGLYYLMGLYSYLQVLGTNK
jgi:hypothetical protein